MPRAFTPNDKYFYKAKREGYAARSAFKLEEIQNKFKILKAKTKVLDLGCAPGSWLQYIEKIIGQNGIAIGLDLSKVEQKLANNIQTFQCDVYDENRLNEILSKFDKFDMLTSDMAPNTSGIHDVDCARSEELCRQVLEIAKIYLKPKGSLVMKIFQGEEFGKIVNETKKYFQKVSCFKPKACRDRSRETYIIGFTKISNV